MSYQKNINRMVSRMSGQKSQVKSRYNNRVNMIKNHLNYQGDNASSIYVEPQKSIPITHRCNVCVVGGGPAGISAAIGASRAGADTMLIERYGCFGGVITTVGMETLSWYRYEGTVDSEGIGIEFERRAVEMGGTSKWEFNDSPCLDAEMFKVIADKLITENNIRPLLHTMVVDTIIESGVMKGIIVENKSGRQAIMCDRVVDCTGDADVAHLAGCKYTVNKKENALGVTSVFNVAGVDKEKFLEHVRKNPATYKDWDSGWEQITSGKEEDLKTPYLEKEFQKAKDDKIIPEDVSLCGSWSALSNAGEATNLNLVHMKDCDPTNAEELTKAEMEGRERVGHAIKALQHTLPGFENCKLRNFGMTLGVRDTRKIVGRYNMTGHDVVGEARFDDSIGIFPEFVDGYNILILPTTGRYFHVPYGCLIPVGVENLLVGGRCIAGDQVAHAAQRNMMCCTVSGQGAGVAAAVSYKSGKNTGNVDIQLVQDELIRQGVRIK